MSSIGSNKPKAGARKLNSKEPKGDTSSKMKKNDSNSNMDATSNFKDEISKIDFNNTSESNSDRENIDSDSDIIVRDRNPSPSNIASSRMSNTNNLENKETKAPKLPKETEDQLSKTGNFKKDDFIEQKIPTQTPKESNI